MYATPKRRFGAFAGLLCAGALAFGAHSAAAAGVAVVDTAGSVAGLPGATMMPGPADPSPTAHLTLVARTVAIAAPGQAIDAYPCPQDAGIDLTCAMGALEDAAARGDRVVNFSFSLPASSVPAVFRDRFAQAVADARADGVLVVAAAYPGGPTFPADLPGVLSVGAEDRDGVPLHPDDNADLYAPGVDLPITDGAGRPYAAFGSSFATAWTSARAALMFDQAPAASPEQVERRLNSEPASWPADAAPKDRTTPVRTRAASAPARIGALVRRGRIQLVGRAGAGTRVALAAGRTWRACSRIGCSAAVNGAVPSRVPVTLISGRRSLRVLVPVSRAGQSMRFLRLTRLP